MDSWNLGDGELRDLCLSPTAPSGCAEGIRDLGMPVTKAPASSLGPSSAHLLAPVPLHCGEHNREN